MIDFLRHKDSHQIVLIHFLEAFLKHILRYLDKKANVYIGITGGMRSRMKQKGFARVLYSLVLATKRIKTHRLQFLMMWAQKQ